MTHGIENGARSVPSSSPLVQQLVDTIQDRIGRGIYNFGTWIRQEALAQELGVSRMPIREALAQLQALGIVEIVPNRGARPRMPSMRELLEVFEVRAVLEGHAAHQAARDITYPQLQELWGWVEAFRAVARRALDDDVEPQDLRAEWVQANTGFHDVVLAACGNTQLGTTVASLHHRVPRNLTWTALDGDPRLLEENAAAHAAIADAIDRRDGEQSRTLMIEHSRRAGELITTRARHLFAS
jgi:DNA-binding GntR family transcriptional regulator